MKSTLFIFFSIITISLSAQDTVQYFAQNQFFELVKANHPIAQQAGLLDNLAIENLKVAKAGFDPKVKSEWERKQFKDKQYYNVWKSGVNLPTRYGLEVDAGYDVASGEFLNPENYLPKQGVGYLGISVNVLQGLIIDERRANLRLANIEIDATNIQQQLIVNELLYQSGKAYWDWVFASNQLKTYNEALNLARQRYQIIKENYQIGEVAGIDTLKAILQVQTREIEYSEAQNNLQNSIVDLSNYLWQNGEPSLLQSNTAAPNLKRLSPNVPNTNFNENHPELLKVEYKLASLEVDGKLKKEKLKPKLKLKYNLLGQEFDVLQNGQDDGVVIAQNYKAGVQFEMSPILRSERANLEMNRIKIDQTNFEIVNKRLTLQNKLNAYLNDWNNNRQQIVLTQNMVKNYQLLLQGEMEKFKVGESDLFIVNTRETQLIEAEIKLLKLLATQQKIALSLVWVNGELR
jgi:outer membrane protein TolC